MAGPDNNLPDPLPRSYGELQAFLGTQEDFNPFELRLAVFKRIQAATGRPLLCYATQTSDVPAGAPVSIDDGDLVGFSDLVGSVEETRPTFSLFPTAGPQKLPNESCDACGGGFGPSGS